MSDYRESIYALKEELLGVLCFLNSSFESLIDEEWSPFSAEGYEMQRHLESYKLELLTISNASGGDDYLAYEVDLDEVVKSESRCSFAGLFTIKYGGEGLELSCYGGIWSLGVCLEDGFLLEVSLNSLNGYKQASIEKSGVTLRLPEYFALVEGKQEKTTKVAPAPQKPVSPALQRGKKPR